jgi:F0F1-type ATP synthase assembly protein I
MWNSPAFSLVGIGTSLAAWIVVPTIVGHWLDSRFVSDPLITLAFLLLGLMVGFFDAYRRLRDVMRESGGS